MDGKLTFDTLRSEFLDMQIPYVRLLETKEWAEARNKIINRDGECCAECNKASTEGMRFWLEDEELPFGAGYKAKIVPSDKEYHLEVHHKYYVSGKLPWQYPDDALVTLCNWCNNEMHQKMVVPYYSSQGEALGYTPCSRCYGTGRLPAYSHVQSGVCFRCAGARYDELIGK